MVQTFCQIEIIIIRLYRYHLLVNVNLNKLLLYRKKLLKKHCAATNWHKNLQLNSKAILYNILTEKKEKRKKHKSWEVRPKAEKMVL